MEAFSSSIPKCLEDRIFEKDIFQVNHSKVTFHIEFIVLNGQVTVVLSAPRNKFFFYLKFGCNTERKTPLNFIQFYWLFL